ncbi:hypothetical protein [Kitasatospora sp. NPDC059673]|uniref:hypothetical protein n=1 Tax=Kitasatospora sp. NPDC059673 TaxID=3346901 RepID=UPI0036B42220
MDNTPNSPLSPHALGPQLLERLTAPLRQAGWKQDETWYEDEEDEDDSGHDAPATVELSRSNFHLFISWSPATGRLVIDDPTDAWDWDGYLPPLFALDEPLTIDLSPYSTQVDKAEAARRAFAAAGLLDTTRIHLPDDATPLRGTLSTLFWKEHISPAIRQHRREHDVLQALKAFGEDFSWRIGSGLRTYPVISPDLVPSAAARGVAEWCWRRESDVEDWHFKIDDIAMARANIAATRAVLPHVHPEAIDWHAVRLALTAPARRLADGQALRDIFEEGWEPILASIHREIDLWQRVDEELGPETTMRMLSMHGSHTESVGEWWGSGWFETVTRRAIGRAADAGTLPASVLEVFTDPEHFADAAAGHPDLLDDDTFAWLTRAVFQERLLRHKAHLPRTTALALPDWVAQSLLAPDDEPSSTEAS